MITSIFNFGTIEAEWERALLRLNEINATTRLWDQDWTLFGEDPNEISNRLGWLDAPVIAASKWAHWASQVDDFLDNATGEAGPITDALILGMGGSSLFPELLATTFESADDYPRLRILDSTHPAAIKRVAAECNPATTVVVAASKSGSTVETTTQLEYFWQWNPQGKNFAVITDPGSALATLAEERSFGSIFLAQPDVGGRFSALTAFGLVPAAMMGLSAEPFIESALEFVESLGADVPTNENLAAQLAAFLSAGINAGRDVMALNLDEPISAFGDWLEQLIAESTGKSGRGLVPCIVPTSGLASIKHTNRLVNIIIGDAIGPVNGNETARTGTELFSLTGVPSVQLTWEEPGDLGAHIVLWEAATALLGLLLEVNPFDQPDVESAKESARGLLSKAVGTAEVSPTEMINVHTGNELLEMITTNDVVALTAFVDPAGKDQVVRVQERLIEQTGVPVTVGVGPRYLHSTGQLHKGGPTSMVVVQVVDRDFTDVDIPDQPFTFGQLFQAQADGDILALASANRRVMRVSLADPLWAEATGD